jgi:hypothetical protein
MVPQWCLSKEVSKIMKITLMILWSVILSTVSAAQAPISCANPGSNGQNYAAQKQVPPPYPYAQSPYSQPSYPYAQSPYSQLSYPYAPSPYPMTGPQQGVNPYMQRGPMQPNIGQTMGPQQAMQPGFIPGVVPQQHISNGFVNSNGNVSTFPQQSAQAGVQYGNITPPVACSCSPKPGQKTLAAANGVTPISAQPTDPKIIAAEQKVAQSAIETAKAAAEAQKIAADSVASSTQEAQKAEQIAKEATQESVAKQQKADELAVVAQNALAAIPASAANDDGVVKLYAGMAADPQSSLPGASVTEEKEGIKVIYSDTSAPVIIRPNKLTPAQSEVLKAQAAESDHQVASSVDAVVPSSSAPAALAAVPDSPASTNASSALNAELDIMNSFSQSLDAPAA